VSPSGVRPPGRSGSPQAVDEIEDLLAIALFAIAGMVAAVGLAVLAGAQLAAVVFGGGSFDAGLSEAVDATIALPSHASAPADAWPESVQMLLPGPVAYWACTGAVLAAAGAVGALCFRWWTGHRHRGPFGVGEGGLAKAGDTRALAVRRPTAGRLTLGLHDRRLLAAEPQTSLAVVGPTGCGKTVGFAIPALLEWHGPILATSVKTDLLDATLTHRQRVGKVWVYDPTSCSGLTAARWSPLSACSDWTGAMRVATWLSEAAQPKADTVTDGDYWYSQARKGLAPYLYAAATSGATMADVVRWVDQQDETEVAAALIDAAGIDTQLAALEREGRPDELRDQHAAEIRNEIIADARDRYGDPTNSRGSRWVEQDPKYWPPEVQAQVDRETELALAQRVDAQVRSEARARRQADGPPIRALISAQALWGKEKRLKGSVFATMENVLAGYADPGVADAASTNELDIADWLSGDNTIFVVATAHEQARLRPVLTVLIQQAIRAAYDEANRRGGTLEAPCLVLLDEAGNIAPLRDLPGYASTARSHGITFVSIWQDLAQIKSIYGERAQTVLNNHRAKLFGAGIADDPTLEYVSRLIGDERRTEVNRSGDLHGPRRSVSEHTSWRRLAPVDAIRRLRTGQGILVYGSIPPVWLRLRPVRIGSYELP
jgi:type IV secretion system protein VirD4